MDNEMIAEFAKLGVTFEGDLDEKDDDATDVWDINWKSVIAFIICQTQWRVAPGFSGMAWLGLDYAGVDVVLRNRIKGRKGRNRVFEDLRVMELEALRTFTEVEA